MRELFNLFGTISINGLEAAQKGMASFEKQVSKSIRPVEKFGKQVAKVGMDLTSTFTVPLAAAGAAAFKAVQITSDLAETTSKVGEVFGAAGKEIEAWASIADKKIGQSKQQAMEAASTFGIFGDSAGLAGDDLVKFSTQFTELASDLASFYNTKPEDAITAIGAAFRGEMEPIRKYGVLLDDATMRQKALEMGIVDSIKTALNPQQKILAASALIMDKTSKAQGDFARTSDDLANLTRILKAEVANLSAEFGKSFLPVALQVTKLFREKLLPAIRGAVDWWNQLPAGVQQTVIKFAAFLAVAGPALVMLGKIISSIKVVTTVFTAAKLAVIAFNAAVASNPYALAVVAIGAFATAIYGAVNAYKDLQREHQKFTLMTTEQAAVKAFTAGVDSLIDKVKEYGDVLNDEAKLNELLGDTVDTLVDQARELGYTIEGNNKKKIESLNIIALELQGVRDQTGALIKYNAEAETTNEKVDKRKKLTEEEIEALKKLAEMREKVEQEYSDKVAELTLNRLELLDREREAAITKAQEIGADTTQIEQYYALQRENIISEENQKRIDRSQERKDAIAALEKQWSDALAGQTMTRLELIEREKQNAIAKAEEAGASTADIVAYYEKLKQDEIDRTSQKTKDQAREWVSGFRDAARQFIGLFQDVTDNRIAQLDNWEARERAAIENSTMLEKQKATALQKLDKDAAKKRRELQREQAKRDKAAALFSTIINTAQAVSKALTLAFPLNIIMSALVGVLGAVQIGIIAAKPLPFKKGGFIRGGRGGVLGEIGEGDEDEIVMPLKTGVGMLADKFIEAISNPQLSSGTPVAAVAGGQSNSAYMPQVIHQWHIGALIADDAGIKELERRQRPIRIAEEQRMGLR